MTSNSPALPVVTLDGAISLEEACAVAEGRMRLQLSDRVRARCAEGHERLQAVLAERRHVYGLTTGFGPLANRFVAAEDGAALQQNLVHHLASGVGPRLGWAEARAAVLARLVSMSHGVSGASSGALDALLAVLDSDLAPELPARGTVGASGDLTPLAHLVLCLQGRGAFRTRSGDSLPGDVALRRLGRAPLALHARDGLALVNGTSAMTGIAVLNSAAAQRALDWSVALTAALAEALCGHAEAWHMRLAELRPHPGQLAVTRALQSRIAGSTLCTQALTSERRLPVAEAPPAEHPGQDAYTLRCAPQVIGAAHDTATWHAATVLRELNSVSDNPVFPVDPDIAALHGGNFMGQHVALASDALSNAALVLAGLAERQVARLTDERLNRGLPPFLHRGRCGLNSGFMGAQVTATALLAELRATGGGAAMQSLSTNAANQDVVSLGTIAARLTADRLSGLTQLHGILALAVAQGVELRQGVRPDARIAPATAQLVAWVRRHAPTLGEDRPLGPEIEEIGRAIARTAPPQG
jgi:tyrosine ammonia-lyase